ncbi:U4/U6-U5 snRNP complex subunit LSM6 ASCRUDRAFT_32300 [Ascoidea rubescens DSM 1968]|uniref:Sm domain-containing protein n=1 Tax=Ascoidea rubescens DSM 1968 TaxID=1344418 RepID=A0A1D2VKR0_9ASCO|nr:hypothetical protein ASCRUDRAFT_32300 [Ascoidea rubescens DSM 1968]ODV62203.1 hypothetical protein ASCRUDRAFT_32300 [Ascoidea rubescens DSM 1968]
MIKTGGVTGAKSSAGKESKDTKEKESSGPAKFLSEIKDNEVIVKLNSGIEYHGILQMIDGYMNIVLGPKTEEYIDNSLTRRYGDVFIRGSKGMFY